MAMRKIVRGTTADEMIVMIAMTTIVLTATTTAVMAATTTTAEGTETESDDKDWRNGLSAITVRVPGGVFNIFLT